MTDHQFRLLSRCARAAQPSTAHEQNTVRSLVKRGWIQRTKYNRRVFVELTREGAVAWSAELQRRST